MTEKEPSMLLFDVLTSACNIGPCDVFVME